MLVVADSGPVIRKSGLIPRGLPRLLTSNANKELVLNQTVLLSNEPPIQITQRLGYAGLAPRRLISLAVIGKLDLLEILFGEVYISEVVWREVSRYIEPFNIPQVKQLAGKVRELTGPNIFADLMDEGEAEAASLYQELNADFLIIDDRAARHIAEAHGVKCVGGLAVLVKARELNLIAALRPLFQTLLSSKRFYKKQLLNSLLADYGEIPLD